ncbi:hypothetical protein NIES2100_13940 [Calothrix sp. NIES-2100]|nr:hypothetical protein NIES2100_13940 [Calothrix sp. NIES-2100]
MTILTQRAIAQTQAFARVAIAFLYLHSAKEKLRSFFLSPAI